MVSLFSFFPFNLFCYTKNPVPRFHLKGCLFIEGKNSVCYSCKNSISRYISNEAYLDKRERLF